MKLFQKTLPAQCQGISKPKNRARTLQGVYFVLASFAVASSASWAQISPTSEPSVARNGGYVGLGVNVGPRYQGSDESRTRAIPAFEYRWANGFFVGGTNGLVGAEVNATRDVRLGIALGVDEGRRESRSRYLAGMGNIDIRGTLNLYAKAALNDQFSLTTSLQMGSGNSGKGALLNVGANYGTSLTPDTRMIFSVATTVANSHYMQENFGVSASQATATRYKRYAPGSDCRDVTAGVSLVHQLSREWMLITSVNRTTLANDAKDSPLVRKASSNSTFASVAYTF